jgi:hypothetical protein
MELMKRRRNMKGGHLERKGSIATNAGQKPGVIKGDIIA